MDKFTIARILAEPNGSNKLVLSADDAISGAWELVRENNFQAVSFFCQICKKRKYAELIKSFLNKDNKCVSSLLLDDNPKMRKNAARLVGILEYEDACETLVQALNKETQMYVRPSQILALGNIRGEASREAVMKYVLPEDATEDEKEALRIAHDSFTEKKGHTYTGFTKSHTVELRCADRLSSALKDEAEQAGVHTVKAGDDFVTVMTENTDELNNLRCYSEMIFPLWKGRADKAPYGKIRDAALSLIKEMHTLPDEKDYPIRFRVEMKNIGESRKKETIRIAKCLENNSFINSVSNYEFEIRIEVKNDIAFFGLKMYTIKDDRFSYRIHSIPASINPSTAAAIIRFASPYLHENASVMDPCCGSGTLLIERAKYSKCAVLQGVDIVRQSVIYAEENSRKAECRCMYIAKNCLEFRADKRYDEIISNLPFGNRVGSHKDNIELYKGILDKLCDWLNKNGTAILYTMEFKLMEKLISEREDKLELKVKTSTEAGGLMPGIFILCRI